MRKHKKYMISFSKIFGVKQNPIQLHHNLITTGHYKFHPIVSELF